ncbi:MAG: hypothetical protein ACOYMQ_19050 [Pseudanabaena sp.]
MSLPVLDFFSRESKVSLQLPVGWEEMEEGNGYVIYYESLDDEDEFFEESDNPVETPHDPKFIIKTFALPAADALAYRKLSEQVLIGQKRQQQEIISQGFIEVDGFEASLSLFKYWDEDEDCKIFQYQIFAQIAEQIVCSITGITEDSLKDTYLSIFEEAVNSIRFIPI